MYDPRPLSSEIKDGLKALRDTHGPRSLVGFGSAFDRQRNGAGLARAIRAALKEAGIGPDDITGHPVKVKVSIDPDTATAKLVEGQYWMQQNQAGMADLDTAIAADPGWALPHVIKAGFLLSLTRPMIEFQGLIGLPASSWNIESSSASRWRGSSASAGSRKPRSRNTFSLPRRGNATTARMPRMTRVTISSSAGMAAIPSAVRPMA